MKSVVVGTAGHIDHGKSALVQALTGTDPDRLKEEKARGITIDLGFAHAELGGVNVAFVDVPGPRAVRQEHAGRGRRHRPGPAGRRRGRIGDAADARTLRHLQAAARPGRRDRADQVGSRRRGNARAGGDRSARAGGGIVSGAARRWSRCRRGPAKASTSCAPRFERRRRRCGAGPPMVLPACRSIGCSRSAGFGTVVTGTLVSGTHSRRRSADGHAVRERTGGRSRCAASRFTAAGKRRPLRASARPSISPIWRSRI